VRLRSLPLYPLLLAAWPPMALAAKNVGQVYRWRYVATPIALAVAVTGLAWALARLARVSPARSAAAAAAVALGVWWYRKLLILVVGSPVIHALGVDRLGGWLVCWMLLGTGYLVIRRLPPNFAEATPFLNLFAGLLLAIPTGQLALRWRPVSEPPQAAAHIGLGAALRDSNAPKPDTYLIILDAYTGAASLARNHGFDNVGFLEALQRRGFVIPRSVRANYVHTILALTSLLNWDSVQAVVPDLSPSSQDPKPLVRAIEENPTWWYFVRRGYRIAFFPSVRAITGSNRYATEGFAEDPADFVTAWLVMTPAPELLRAWHSVAGRWGDSPSPTTRKAALDDRQFASVGALRRDSRPLFAFAHFLLPHTPFVYRANCSYRDPPIWARADRSTPDSVVGPAYVKQLICVNRRVLALVDQIRQAGRPDPVIILMSDHGFGKGYRGLPPLGDAAPEDVAERLDAFAAVLVPAGARDAFRGDLSPTGVMRATMREVFGLNLPRRREPSFWSPDARVFDLTRVPDEAHP
jgi:hypothetical protein